MRYYLYCDESTLNGTKFSYFYGGVMVNADDFNMLNDVLNSKREQTVKTSELKWTKVSAANFKEYIDAVDTFFDFIQADKAKVRIMFTQNRFKANMLTEIQKNNTYGLLYYQFIKHAFGLKYLPTHSGPNYLEIFLDTMPDEKEKKIKLKQYLHGLQYLPSFLDANIQIHQSAIVEVDSSKHILMQYLDVVLGAMAFKLNRLDKVKQSETGKRGKRTLAKEKVYKHINKRIRLLYPNFNIGISTGKRDDYKNILAMPYRHWLFLPTHYEVENE